MVSHRRQMICIPGEEMESPHEGQGLKGRQGLRTYQLDLRMSPDSVRHSLQIVDVPLDHFRYRIVHVPELGGVMVFLNLHLQQDKAGFVQGQGGDIGDRGSLVKPGKQLGLLPKAPCCFEREASNEAPDPSCQEDTRNLFDSCIPTRRRTPADVTISPIQQAPARI